MARRRRKRNSPSQTARSTTGTSSARNSSRISGTRSSHCALAGISRDHQRCQPCRCQVNAVVSSSMCRISIQNPDGSVFSTSPSTSCPSHSRRTAAPVLTVNSPPTCMRLPESSRMRTAPAHAPSPSTLNATDCSGFQFSSRMPFRASVLCVQDDVFFSQEPLLHPYPQPPGSGSPSDFFLLHPGGLLVGRRGPFRVFVVRQRAAADRPGGGGPAGRPATQQALRAGRRALENSPPTAALPDLRGNFPVGIAAELPAYVGAGPVSHDHGGGQRPDAGGAVVLAHVLQRHVLEGLGHPTGTLLRNQYGRSGSQPEPGRAPGAGFLHRRLHR